MAQKLKNLRVKKVDFVDEGANQRADIKLLKNKQGEEAAGQKGMAYTWIYRILRFDDEIRHDKRHTKEHFDQILEDIQNYKDYCRDHPEFPNNKAQFAIMNIESIYKKCVEEGTFL